MPADSLIQQRIAIDRMRVFGGITASVGIVLLIAGVVFALGRDALAWTGLVAPVFFVVVGLNRLVTARRTRIEFESEHGREAGRQEPVR